MGGCWEEVLKGISERRNRLKDIRKRKDTSIGNNSELKLCIGTNLIEGRMEVNRCEGGR